jgi:hypothetical protein
MSAVIPSPSSMIIESNSFQIETPTALIASVISAPLAKYAIAEIVTTSRKIA